MRGLLQYLAGPGRENEHTHPHVISGDHYVQAWHGAEELSRAEAAAIAEYLDHPRKTYGTEIRSKVWQQNPETGAREPVLDGDGQQVWKDVNVWHCSLSLPPGEVLSAEQWDAVATDFADEMGFTAVSGKAPARWVAIHHGASKNGNDHIHVAASMVREDGTRWEGRLRDYPKAQAVCRDLERKHGLTAVAGRQHGTAGIGVQPVEQRRAVQAGSGVTDRQQLGQLVRAAAVASTSEAEWVRRVRASGVVIKPRFVAGSTDVVAGYRVALKGRDRLNFYGGGQLGHDLSLPRVRESWPEPSIEAADQAAAEWQAAFRNQRTTVEKPREQKVMDPEVAARNLQAFTQKLTTTPVTDRVAWSDAARDLSGALSAWAQFDPAHATELRDAAGVLARSAQDRRAGRQIGRRVKESPMGTAFLFLAAASDKTTVPAFVLMNQILQTATALRDYHQATANTRQAQAIETHVLDRLSRLQLSGYQPDLTRLSETERATWQVRQALNPTPAQPVAGSPLPNPLDPRPRTSARTTNREAERDGR